jgi:tyrosine-protein phosphatase
MPGMSPSTSNSSNSATDSASSTPSTSPPLPISSEERELTYPSLLTLEPYSDGPIEIIPGVWLGAEDSVWHFDSWARGKDSVGIVNVAQEIENPFDPNTSTDTWDWPSTAKGKPKVALSSHQNEGQPRVEYAHLRWSHGEGGLADLPDAATLDELVSSPTYAGTPAAQQWRFWEAVRWLEVRRRAGTPVLIHCQCGVSRSATLIVAYVMTLAAAGVAPQRIGHLKTMQDAYDYVKSRSPWIGPNVS